jgi:hypothetical protein
MTTTRATPRTGVDEGGARRAARLYDKAVAIVLRDKKVSTSYIQRRLQIGYNRAASIIERMEKEGVVGPANHAGKREISAASATASRHRRKPTTRIEIFAPAACAQRPGICPTYLNPMDFCRFHGKFISLTPFNRFGLQSCL